MGNAIFTPLTQNVRQLLDTPAMPPIDGQAGRISVALQLFCDQLHLEHGVARRLPATQDLAELKTLPSVVAPAVSQIFETEEIILELGNRAL
jgi:hypothetical protein